MVSAPVHPTELVESVDRAITNIFPDAQLEFKDVTNRQCLLIGTASLDKLRELLMKQNILDSARAELFNSISGNRIEFKLNKQVAFMGKANFGESSLGDIRVSIECENPEEVIYWLAPRI
ncbi:MAG: hypothetical protein LRZ87_04285 [Methanocellales archaeon]|nr:hypothetical protein [Methanocellales archaeon]